MAKKRINQKNPADCAVCALAMFLGYDYDEILDLLPYLVGKIQSVQTGGLTSIEERLICAVLRPDDPVVVISNHHDPDGKKTKKLFKMLKGIPALMAARSLNHPNVGHAVYWDGSKIIDPSNKKRYTKKTIKPYEIMF